MATSEDKEKLHIEILKGDLDAYRKLETWGSSLFLGALGLLAKQLVDWDLNSCFTKHLPLAPFITILPAMVGLIAFVFLRIVNFRSHKSNRQLRGLAGLPYKGLKESFGSLGFCLAIMPLIFGYTVSWYLSAENPERQCWRIWVTMAGGLVILIAVVIHCWSRKLRKLGRILPCDKFYRDDV